jgi:hypothetical protein
MAQESDVRIEWLPYENDALVAIHKFYGNRVDGKFIHKFFPHKTRQECDSRWIGHKIETLLMSGIKKKGHDLLDTPHQSAEKPYNMGSIPLEPFTIICGYLSAKTVFRKLPLVCKHFNEMLKKYKVPVKSAKIGYHLPEEIILVQYLKRISHCEKLVLDLRSVYRNEKSLWMKTWDQLLNQLRPSVKELRVHSDWFPNFASFLATSSQIRTFHWIGYAYANPWIWDAQLKCSSLRSLVLDCPPSNPTIIRDLLNMLPNLENLHVAAYFPNHNGLEEEIEWTKAANLKSVTGDFLPPMLLLSNLENLDINVLTRRNWYRLLSMLPKLVNLKTLKIHSKFVLQVTYGAHDHWQKITGLQAFMMFNAITNNPTISHVEYGSYLEEESYWDCPLNPWILDLPETVKKIVYFEQTVRPEENDQDNEEVFVRGTEQLL